MNWLRTLHQMLSYKLGYRRGRQGRPFQCPWWADTTTFAAGHIDGQGARLQLDGRLTNLGSMNGFAEATEWRSSAGNRAHAVSPGRTSHAGPEPHLVAP
jgi:hypothetical protein